MSGTVGDFQTQVYLQPAPGVEGAFASANPYASVLGSPGAFVAGLPAPIIGHFAWVDPADLRTARSTGTGLPDGFVHRDSNPVLITPFLARASMVTNVGRELTLHSRGDFWVVNNGTKVVQRGQKAFAKFADGSIYFDTAGATPLQAASVTGSIAAATSAFTGAIAPTPAYSGAVPVDVLTVTAVSSGILYPGQTISGAGIASGTQILEQITSSETDGHFGAKGTYYVSPMGQTVASEAITGAHGLMTVTAVGSGAVAVGDVLAAGGGGNGATVAGSLVTANGLGADAGKFVVNNNTVVTSGTIVMAGAVETDHWWAMNGGVAVGELVKMSSWRLG